MDEHAYAGIANRALQTIEELNQLIDIDGILDRILLDVRELASADAGSIYLVDGDQLKFSFVHNDSLFTLDEGNKMVYAEHSVPMDSSSIVGYAATKGETVVIDDAYALPSGLPYGFNKDFDRATGYRTRSVLTVPLRTLLGKLVGVMQIINAKDHLGQFTAFSPESRWAVPMLANKAAAAIERGLLTRDQILRMMKMAELRDPAETGAHVQRVGAIAAELYRQWAVNRALAERRERPLAENPHGMIASIKQKTGLLRLAAMLHDVGKVGVADAILKKPGRLDEREFDVMQRHTVFGARLFVDAESELDRMCYDIALHHHERWDGGGYPGTVVDVTIPGNYRGGPLSGSDIPIAARITAVADVFDALSSKRCYKTAWDEDRVLSILREESGKQFDPEVVDAFFDIYDIILAIQNKFTERQRIEESCAEVEA